MKLAISNIAWNSEKDIQMYQYMHDNGYEGIEIAPTRIFSDNPYNDLIKAAEWANKLQTDFSLCISSMQSIWYGRKENLFNSIKEREELLRYTQKAIDFAVTIKCGNLVFGCPKNRNITDNAKEKDAIPFFKIIGDYAWQKGTVIGLEANPLIYHTNFINSTQEALDFIEQVDSKGIRLNLDIGTMVVNNETPDILVGKVCYINHVHLSEPRLSMIIRRKLHKDIIDILEKENYKKYISIEMAEQEDINKIFEVMKYLRYIV